MEYLGFAVNSILNSKEVSEDVKVSIAKDYLSVVLIYSEGKLKSKHSHYWEDMAPSFVVETALFLNEKKVFNWGDVNVIRKIELVDAIDRSIKSPEDFLGFYEQKILGLMDVTEEIGEGTKSLAEVVKKCLEYRMETDTRFRFLKFAYKYTKYEENSRKVLEFMKVAEKIKNSGLAF
jgi:hypothetical protein